jgi:hypothetical protein
MKCLRVSIPGCSAFLSASRLMICSLDSGGLNGLLGARWVGGPEIFGLVARTPWGAFLFRGFPFWVAQVYWAGLGIQPFLRRDYCMLCCANEKAWVNSRIGSGFDLSPLNNILFYF